MSSRLFGTDGIRGPFGTAPLDQATVTRLGAALGAALQSSNQPAVVVLGGDTRSSTATLAGWLAAGLRGADAEIRYAGTIPTPGVATLVRSSEAACGIAISASHNPMPDNGIKLLDGTGTKWTTGAERQLEERLASGDHPEPLAVDELTEDPSLAETYRATLRDSLPGDRPLAGMRIVVDCAHGAASSLAPSLFEELGAEVSPMGNRPTGDNINLERGSTHPEAMAAAVEESSADLGVAFDGDADRVMLADERGRIRDGDAILYLWSRALAERGELEPRAIVATSMSNLGLEVALRDGGIEVVRCDVGDRVVFETLVRNDLLLGGEQSGHIIHRGLSTTGDGMLTAIHVAHLLRASEGPLSDLLSGLPRFPQTLQNVRVRTKPDLDSLPAVAAARTEVETALGDRGRLVLRYSGTEPLARVMIEGPDQEAIERMAGELVSAISREIGVE